MKPSTRDVYLKYIFFSNIAQENASLMCGSGSYSDLCGDRMAELGEAERNLLALPEEEMCDELKAWLAIKNDKKKLGCSSCWISSRAKKEHFECAVNISSYFHTRHRFHQWANKLMRDCFANIEPEVSEYEEMKGALSSLKELVNAFNTQRDLQVVVQTSPEFSIIGNGYKVTIDKDMKLSTTGEIPNDILLMAQMVIPFVLVLNEEKRK